LIFVLNKGFAGIEIGKFSRLSSMKGFFHMSGYDISKDKVLAVEEVAGDGNTLIELSLCSYDNGPAKVQLSRCVKVREVKTYRKLGRLGLLEATRLAAALMTIGKKAP
jgi:hypothetical protein